MQDILHDEKTKPDDTNYSHRTLATSNILLLGFYGVIFVIAVNTPWVRRFVVDANSGDPLVGIGYWVLAALFSLFLAWNIMRNLAFKRRGVRIGVQLALIAFWFAWISWLTNDRMNASDAFTRLDVVVNVVAVGIFAAGLALPIVWYDKVRGFIRDKRRNR